MNVSFIQYIFSSIFLILYKCIISDFTSRLTCSRDLRTLKFRPEIAGQLLETKLTMISDMTLSPTSTLFKFSYIQFLSNWIWTGHFLTENFSCVDPQADEQASVDILTNGVAFTSKWEANVFKFVNQPNVFLHCRVRICFNQDGQQCDAFDCETERKRRAAGIDDSKDVRNFKYHQNWHRDEIISGFVFEIFDFGLDRKSRTSRKNSDCKISKIPNTRGFGDRDSKIPEKFRKKSQAENPEN